MPTGARFKVEQWVAESDEWMAYATERTRAKAVRYAEDRFRDTNLPVRVLRQAPGEEEWQVIQDYLPGREGLRALYGVWRHQRFIRLDAARQEQQAAKREIRNARPKRASNAAAHNGRRKKATCH